MRFGEDAVFDEGDAKGAELLIDPGAKGFREIFLKFVDCRMVSESVLGEEDDCMAYEVLRRTPRQPRIRPT